MGQRHNELDAEPKSSTSDTCWKQVRRLQRHVDSTYVDAPCQFDTKHPPMPRWLLPFRQYFTKLSSFCLEVHLQIPFFISFAVGAENGSSLRATRKSPSRRRISAVLNQSRVSSFIKAYQDKIGSSRRVNDKIKNDRNKRDVRKEVPISRVEQLNQQTEQCLRVRSLVSDVQFQTS